ncbi:MAG: guanylate kinase [Spirulinaceae cyanobacterium]
MSDRPFPRLQAQHQVTLRPITPADEPFLRQLYTRLRAAEFAALPEPQRAAVLETQFNIHQQGYRQEFPEADFWLVQQRGQAIGRLTLDDRPDHLHIVDLALSPDVQNQGIGTALLQDIQAIATERNCPVRLMVVEHNRARRLYERLGFCPTGGTERYQGGVYLAMTWTPTPPEPATTGQLVVLTGPSGVGKGTLVKALLQRHPERLCLSVSATTRSPRPGEVHGQHYWFLERAEFEAQIEQGLFLEWAEYAGNLYGTLSTTIEEEVKRGRTVILEIELVGARAVKAVLPEAKRIFILPPSLAELERRLRDRATDDEAAIAKRLERAQVELAAAPEFDVQIVNDDLDTALADIEAAIAA